MKKIILSIALLTISIIYALALYKYPGNWVYYTIFTIVFNYALIRGVFLPHFYFETFWYGFLWLGFWFKFTFRTLTENYNFIESTGNFVKSGENFDLLLQVSTIAVAASLVATESIAKFSKKNSTLIYYEKSFDMLSVYKKHTYKIWLSTLVLMIVTAIVNTYFGIYIRGMISETKLPGIIRNLIVWLTLSGFSCVMATFIYWEMLLKRNNYGALVFALFENFISNTSMLSRAFIINASSHVWSFFHQPKSFVFKKALIIFISFFVLFIISTASVGYLRYAKYPEAQTKNSVTAHGFVRNSSTLLLIDRWVGLEGLMSVMGYGNLGWDLWYKAWLEKMDETKSGFYDSEIAKSRYAEDEITTQHFITLPGTIAFLFYTGSSVFLFVVLMFLTAIFILIEISIKKFLGNPLLVALFSQSAAYKLLHFGYAPRQSWKYFGAFFLTLLCIYFLQKIKVRVRS